MHDELTFKPKHSHYKKTIKYCQDNGNDNSPFNVTSVVQDQHVADNDCGDRLMR